jgi:chorismate mutase
VTARLEHLSSPAVGTPRLRGVRGAVTVEADTPECVDAAVRDLIDQLASLNAIDPCDVVSAIFSATADLRSRNPATAARSLGWTDVPLMCVAELETDGMLERCVRVLLHVSVADGRRLTPVYLGDAAMLRPDLAPVAAMGGAR